MRYRGVAVRDGYVYFVDMAPPPELLQSWTARLDNQIMGLEVVSISLGECIRSLFLH